jgi:hypothetical protein
MATTRPFAYNPTASPIAGTSQVGTLAVGITDQNYSINPGGVSWWMGPDEDLGYVIAVPVSGNTQPTNVPEDALFLSPTYKGTDIVLYNNNQTAAQIFGYQQSVLGINQIGTTDKVMFSVLCTLAEPGVLADSHFVGVGYTTMNYSGNPYGGFPGNDNQSMGYGSNGTIWYNGGVYQGGLQEWGNNDIIDIVVDNNTNDLWVRVNGGNWNNNPSANPATGSNGIETIGGPFYPVLCPSYEGTMIVQNLSSYSIPNGYNFLGNLTASVGFYRTDEFTDGSFIVLSQSVSEEYGTPQTFSSATEASIWLTNNGYWNSYTAPVLYLDASNPASYPGTGTTWYDISGNGNDVTMVNSNSITWNNSLPVYFSTGVNGWFNNPSGSNLPTGNSNYTFIIWVQLGSTWNGNGLMSIGSFGTSNQSNAFRAASTNVLLNYWWANDLVVSTSVSPTNGWFNAVATYDGTTRSIWVNGTLVGSNTPVGHNVITSTLQIAKTADVEFLNGNVGEVFVYDRGLTSEEILSIWNATKSRYGL